MKATLGQRPAGVVGNLENELLLLLSEVAKFRGEEYWQRAVGGGGACNSSCSTCSEGKQAFRPQSFSCPQITFHSYEIHYTSMNKLQTQVRCSFQLKLVFFRIEV